MTLERALHMYHSLNSSCFAYGYFTYAELVQAEEMLRLKGYRQYAHTIAENTPSQMSGDWDNNPEHNEEA